jgi:hypothetical protein
MRGLGSGLTLASICAWPLQSENTRVLQELGQTLALREQEIAALGKQKGAAPCAPTARGGYGG